MLLSKSHKMKFYKVISTIINLQEITYNSREKKVINTIINNSIYQKII
jgi:hypothetical protein